MRQSTQSPEMPDQTPDACWQRLSPEIRDSFSPAQAAAVQELLVQATRRNQPNPKLVDLRFTVDLVLSRFYVVLLVGKDRRQRQRSYLPDALSRTGNRIAAVALLIGLNLLVSLFVLLLVYLVKSALGVDLVPDAHLADQVEKLR